MYTTTRNRAGYDRLYYSEKDYILNDRFYPGELGIVALLGIAGLLLWGLCMYGILTPDTYHAGYGSGYVMSDTSYDSDMTTDTTVTPSTP